MCITDFSGSSQYMDLVDGLIAGSDIWDSPMPKIHTTKAANYENDAYIVTQMRNAMHHILYTVVNSNAMNGWHARDTLKTVTPWWQTAIYALIAVLAVLTVLCAWQLSKALKRKKSAVQTPLPRRTSSNLQVDSCSTFAFPQGSQETQGSLSTEGGRLPLFIRDKRRDRNGRTNRNGAECLNRAKTYQLVLFPLNNGATTCTMCWCFPTSRPSAARCWPSRMLFASVMVTACACSTPSPTPSSAR